MPSDAHVATRTRPRGASSGSPIPRDGPKRVGPILARKPTDIRKADPQDRRMAGTRETVLYQMTSESKASEAAGGYLDATDNPAAVRHAAPCRRSSNSGPEMLLENWATCWTF
jgi:hypothetical protein